MSRTDNTQQTTRYEAADYTFHPLREALAIGLIVFVSSILVSVFIHYRALDAQKGEFRDGLIRMANVICTLIDPELHKTFVHRDQEQSPKYLQAIAPLAACTEADPTIVYIYTLIKKDGEMYFILDPTPEGDADGDGLDDKSHIMQHYDLDEPDPFLDQAFETQQAVVTQEPFTDEWGTFMSGYSPFFDTEGNFVGILGVDIDAEAYNARLQPIKRATTRAIMTSTFLALIIASLVWFLRNFAQRVNQRRLELIHCLDELKSDLQQGKEVNKKIESIETHIHKPSIRIQSHE